MKIRMDTQKRFKQTLLTILILPIERNVGTLQTYLLRNSIVHALQLHDNSWAENILQRFDFLLAYQSTFGLNTISHYWLVVDPNECGTAYETPWNDLRQGNPTHKKATRIRMLVELFIVMRWHEKASNHISKCIQWLQPYQNNFSNTIRYLKRNQALLAMQYGNAKMGLQQFDTLLANSKSRTSVLLREIITLISTPHTPERCVQFEAILTEVQTFPANTPNRFRIEQIALNFAFDTLKEREQAIANLESIIPFQKGLPDSYQQTVDRLYFDLYCKYKDHAKAIPYGIRVLNNSTDKSRVHLFEIQCKIHQCRLHTETPEQSVERYHTLSGHLEHIDDRKALEVWNLYLLELSQRLTNHYTKNKQWDSALNWRTNIVQIRRTQYLDMLTVRSNFDIADTGMETHRLAVTLYQIGIVHIHLQDPSSAKRVWDEAIQLYDTIIQLNRTEFNKGLANILWKRHSIAYTPDNITGLKRCLELRTTLFKNGDKSQHFLLVHVHNTLGLWSLDTQDWTASVIHLEVCSSLLSDLIQEFPTKSIYSRSLTRVQTRLAWDYFKLSEYDKALTLVQNIMNEPSSTLDNLQTTIATLMGRL